MSSSQIKDSSVRIDSNLDNAVNKKFSSIIKSLARTPDGDDTNPYDGGTIPAAAGTVRFSKLSDDLVSVSWSTMSGTGGAAKKLGWNVVPAELRPNGERAGMCKVTDNGTVKDGVVKVLANGDLVFSITADAAFTGSGASGMTAGTMIYSRL